MPPSTTTISTTTTSTTTSTTTTTTTTTSSTQAENMLFDVELLGSDKNYEEELEELEYEEQEEYDDYEEGYGKALLNHPPRAYPISGKRKQRKWDEGMGKTITREG